MSVRSLLSGIGQWTGAAQAALVLGWMPACLLAAPQDSKPPEKEARVEIGQCASPAGTLLQREASGKEWQVVKSKAAVSSSDLFMALPGTRAAIESKNGAVRLSLLGNLPEISMLPLLESAVKLHSTDGADLEFTLERGRVELANVAKKGPAKVRVRFRDQKWDLTLDEPGSAVALELYSHWPPGVPFTKEAKPEQAPWIDVGLYVLKGDSTLKADSQQYALHAPPGPAFFSWESISGQARGPQFRGKVPSWTLFEASTKPEDKLILAIAKHLSQRLVDKPVTEALTATLTAGSIAEQKAAIYGQGAVGDLARVVDALGDPQHPEVRSVALETLRQWVSRGHKAAVKLFDVLVEKKKYTPAQAEIVVQLLHNFGPADLTQPETYETLIANLQNSKLPIRELAKWHLEHMVPAGKEIGYNPAGSEPSRAEAIRAWKALVPTGQLPPKAKPKKEAK